MSKPWDTQANKRAKAKKERGAFKKSSDSNISESEKDWILTTPPENAKAGILASIHKDKVEILIDHEILEGGMAPYISPHALMDFVVGDRVWVDTDTPEWGLILGREERKSFVGRTKSGSFAWHVLAANVDVGVIVVALQTPALHPTFIDRYLLLLQNGGVQPVICVTKNDLSIERPSFLDFYTQIGIPVIETSSLLNQGIDELKKIISQKTVIFVGQSGVGKSSLINAIDPSHEIVTQAVNTRTGEGKHTTTRSNLYQWAEDSFIIDTPGIRSLSIDVIPKDQIRFLFPELSALASACKFHSCLHLAEPGCAVKHALEEGKSTFAKRRYESYVQMMGE